jgi:hypothetical protein
MMSQTRAEMNVWGLTIYTGCQEFSLHQKAKNEPEAYQAGT